MTKLLNFFDFSANLAGAVLQAHAHKRDQEINKAVDRVDLISSNCKSDISRQNRLPQNHEKIT